MVIPINHRGAKAREFGEAKTGIEEGPDQHFFQERAARFRKALRFGRGEREAFVLVVHGNTLYYISTI